MSFCDVPVVSSVCSFVNDSAQNTVSAPFIWLADGIGHAAEFLFDGMWTLMTITTRVDVTDMISVYNVVFGIAVVLMLGFFLLQLITGMIHRDPTTLSRASLGLARSIYGSFLAVSVTAILLEIADQLSAGIILATGNTVEGMGTKISVLLSALVTVNVASPAVGALVVIFLGCLMIAAIAITWFSLLIRKSLILIAIVLAPLALSGESWEVTKGWARKWIVFMVALITSKVVMVLIFLVGVTQVDAPLELDLPDLADPLAGIVILFLAAFAPYLAYKFISFVGFDMHQMMSTEQEAKSALDRPLPLPHLPSGDNIQKILGNDSASENSPPRPDNASPDAEAASGGGTPEIASDGAAAGSEAGAAGGSGAAAAGPAAAAVIAAEVVKGTAEAGPELGNNVGSAAHAQAGAAENGSTGGAPASDPGPPPAGPVLYDPPPDNYR